MAKIDPQDQKQKRKLRKQEKNLMAKTKSIPFGTEQTEPGKYSVLMSVYNKEKAEHLREAMDSIWRQTTKADEFILICDGPLTSELDTVIEEEERAHGEKLQVIRLKENGGLGNALNIGLKHCRNELIARMDSDDISRDDRCERQLKVFTKHPEFSIVSGTIEEFTEDTGKVTAKRMLPETQEEILAFARKRSPFNHPCVMYRKSAVEAAGGYRRFYLLEDYYLWVRMLQTGCIGYNTPETLLWMRTGSELYRRRAGWKYAKSEGKLFRYMAETGFISKTDCIRSTTTRAIAAMIPNQLRGALMRRFFRAAAG